MANFNINVTGFCIAALSSHRRRAPQGLLRTAVRAPAMSIYRHLS
jgi:hypothetical protein